MQRRYRPDGRPTGCCRRRPFSFDVSVWEFFWPLHGRRPRWCWPSPAAHRDPRATRRAWSSAESITTIALRAVDAARPSWRSRTWSAAAPACAGSSAAARRCRPQLARTLLRPPGRPSCTTCTGRPRRRRVTACASLRGARTAPVPIGRPIANTRVYVARPRLQPVPVGRAGRAATSAASAWPAATSAGPALTAERFVARPVRPRAARACTAPATCAAGCPTATLEFLGPRRPPGQDPRLPDRAGRDRGRAARAPGRAPGGRGRRARTARATRAWSPTWSPTAASRRAAELRALPGAVAAGATWCRPPSSARRAAADAPAASSTAGRLPAPERRRRATSRARPPRTPTEERLAAIWGEVLGLRARRRPRQLLRARRPLAAGDPGRGQDAPGAGRGPAAARAVRAAHGRRHRAPALEAGTRDAGHPRRWPSRAGAQPLSSRSSGCGSSTGWCPAAPPTASSTRRLLSGPLDVPALRAA